MARIVTIQQTGKGWKFVQLIGFGMVLVGIIGCMTVSDKIPEPDRVSQVSHDMLLAFGGLAVFIFGRIGGWWSHG